MQTPSAVAARARHLRTPLSSVQIFGIAEAAAILGTDERGVRGSMARGRIRGLVWAGTLLYRTARRSERPEYVTARDVTVLLERRGGPIDLETRTSAVPLSASAASTAAGVDGRTVHGHFAVFNEWTRIDSLIEGTFMERIAPGAFASTFARDRQGMRVLLNHGRSLDAMPIAAIKTLREDARGAYYEAQLLDVPDLLLSGLRAGQYGASFKFKVEAETIASRPRASSHNPEALPERTITEARVYEFGPVTFPAYPTATATLAK